MTDREKLIKLIDQSRITQTEHSVCINGSAHIADFLIANGVTFAKDTNVPSKWISVEDRLPKEATNRVLVYCKCGYIGFGHYGEFQGVKEWYDLDSGKLFREWDLDDCETHEITHWMPMPEPPNEEPHETP